MRKAKIKKKLRKTDRAKAASILLVAIAVLFNLYITTPVLSHGSNDSGDDAYHMSQSHYMKKLILEENMIFGVVHAYGIGYPWYNTHQWLMYFTEVAINLLSFEMISLLDAHKILLILFYSLHPVGVYYALTKFRQKPMMAAFGALLAAMPISGWGHTTTAYFVIGLTSQSMGGFLFPFALGSFHEMLVKKTGYRKVALLYVLTSFAHPYYGYFLVFASALDILAFAVGRKRKEIADLMKYAVVAGVLSFLLALFWLAPLPTTIKYAPRNLNMQAAPTSFSIQSGIDYFLEGQLLDVSDNFGNERDKNLRWPTNTGRGRLPILTWLTLLGLFIGMLKRSRFSIYLILLFLISFILLVGKDDFGFLEYLPFSEHANPKRTIYLFEFCAIALSAFSLHTILEQLTAIATKYRFRIIGLIISTAILAGVLYTPYNERLQTAEREVNTLAHWIPSFDAMRVAINLGGKDGRVYADDEVGVKSAPVILSQPWLMDNPYMRRIYATRFWGDILKYPQNFGLFNIRYLVTGSQFQIPQNLSHMFKRIYRDRLYSLYRVEGDFGPAVISYKTPALLHTTEEGWRVMVEVWLHYYKTHENPTHLPYMVQYREQYVNPSDYSMLLTYDKAASDVPTRLSKTVEGNHSWRHQMTKAAIRGDNPDKNDRLIDTVMHTQNTYGAIVEADKTGIIAYKTTYHPYWNVYIDGKKQTTLRTTLEWPAAWIKPGRHFVEFKYEKPLEQTIFEMISLITLIFTITPKQAIDYMKNKIRR
jgi:hypothetical protein